MKPTERESIRSLITRRLEAIPIDDIGSPSNEPGPTDIVLGVASRESRQLWVLAGQTHQELQKFAGPLESLRVRQRLTTDVPGVCKAQNPELMAAFTRAVLLDRAVKQDLSIALADEFPDAQGKAVAWFSGWRIAWSNAEPVTVVRRDSLLRLAQ